MNRALSSNRNRNNKGETPKGLPILLRRPTLTVLFILLAISLTFRPTV